VSSQFSFEALFHFLETIGETRILSNPKLSVVNNQEARIHVGRREAYITTTTTTGQTTTTTAEEVTFVDIGIQLAVTPTINDEGFITMKIKPEISSVVDTLVTPSGNEIPIIDTSTAETTVLVKDGSTIVIGGLRSEEEALAQENIPFLGKLPLIGFLFGNKTADSTRTELLVMITPTIVEGNKLVTGDVEPGKEGAKPYKEYIAFEPAEEEEVKLQLKPYTY
jgi:general secretion pathway protein D